MKTVDETNPCPEDIVTYRITVTNSGPARATSVTLTDHLPSGVTRTGTPPAASQGSFNDGSGLWSVGTLNAGNSATLDLEVSVDAGASGTINNSTSALNLDQTDVAAGNNTGVAGLTVADGIDVSLQPVNISTCQGGTAVFEVAADGGDLLWQWFKDGDPIPGADSRILSFVVTSPADAGNYYCEIDNDCAGTTSNSASLTVDDGVLILSVDPGSAVRGLGPVVLTGSGECVTARAGLLWTNLGTGATSTDNPLILADLQETTTFELTDSAEGGGAFARVTVLVAANPLFYDYNGDGCNNLLDL